MPRVVVKKDESIEKAIRRFRKQCKRESLIEEIRKRRCYIKPSDRRRMHRSKVRRKRGGR